MATTKIQTRGFKTEHKQMGAVTSATLLFLQDIAPNERTSGRLSVFWPLQTLVFSSLSWFGDPGQSRPPSDGGRRCDSELHKPVDLFVQFHRWLLQRWPPHWDQFHRKHDPPQRLQVWWRTLQVQHLWSWTLTWEPADCQRWATHHLCFKAELFVCLYQGQPVVSLFSGRPEAPDAPHACVLLPVVGVCLPLVSLLCVTLLCLWRSHKGQNVSLYTLLLQRYFRGGSLVDISSVCIKKQHSAEKGQEMRSESSSYRDLVPEPRHIVVCRVQIGV